MHIYMYIYIYIYIYASCSGGTCDGRKKSLLGR